MIPCQKHLFNIPEDVTYLNCAYLSPQLRSVSGAGYVGVAAKEQPWQIIAQDFFTKTEQTRRLFAEMIDAQPDDIAIIPAVSYGVAVAALNIRLKAGDTILILEDQFPSNVYPWREVAKETGAIVKTLSRPEDEDWTRDLLACMDEDTAVVAVPNCHWTNGGMIDLVKIGDRCRNIGAALVIDATQSIGALPFSVPRYNRIFLSAPATNGFLDPIALVFYMFIRTIRMENHWSMAGLLEKTARILPAWSTIRMNFNPAPGDLTLASAATLRLCPW